jgi:hypothetical protein
LLIMCNGVLRNFENTPILCVRLPNTPHIHGCLSQNAAPELLNTPFALKQNDIVQCINNRSFAKAKGSQMAKVSRS